MVCHLTLFGEKYIEILNVHPKYLKFQPVCDLNIDYSSTFDNWYILQTLHLELNHSVVCLTDSRSSANLKLFI